MVKREEGQRGNFVISSNQIDVSLSSWASLQTNITWKSDIGVSEKNLVCYRFDKGFKILQSIRIIES